MRRPRPTDAPARPGRPGAWLLPAVGVLLAGPPALAIEVGGRISAGAIYSDNITLAPDGFEDSDVVFRTDPTIFIDATGNRYDFRLQYTLEALYYLDQPDSTEVYNQGEVTLDLELLEEHLFLNTYAGIDQAVVDPEEPFSSSNIPQIANRTDAMRYGIGPEWRQDLLGGSLEIRYDVGSVNYDDDTLQDGDFQLFSADYEGPDKERGLSWEAHHEYRQYNYEVSDDAARQLAEIGLVLNLGGGWAPFVSAGMESDVQDRTDASLEDGIWRAGIRRSTARTFFEAFVGERSFGSSWGAQFERQYGADSGDVFRISYAEIPTTEELDSTLERLTEPPGGSEPGVPTPPDPVLPPDPAAPGSGDYYLSKRGDIVLTRTFNRSTASLNLFYDDNENLDQGPEQDSDDSAQTGVSFFWSYALGARTSAILDGLWANREFSRTSGEDDEDTLTRARVGLRYELGEQTWLAGWLAHEEQSGSNDETDDYDENQIGLTIGRTF